MLGPGDRGDPEPPHRSGTGGGLRRDRVPAIIVEGARDYGIRFFGIPMGYEFTNLIDAIIVASSGTPSLGAETLERLAGLKERVHIQVVLDPHLTPLSPGRAPGASPGGRLGVDPRRLRARQQSSPSLAQRYMVMAVPKTVVNDRVSFRGRDAGGPVRRRRAAGGRRTGHGRGGRMTWEQALTALGSPLPSSCSPGAAAWLTAAVDGLRDGA